MKEDEENKSKNEIRNLDFNFTLIDANLTCNESNLACKNQ